MKSNMSKADRIIRALLGVAGLVLGIVMGGLWWIAGGLGIVFLATSLIGFCPLYLPFKIDTAGRKD
jgi:hypothetical protein